jgi:SPP1 gp7 family putative phage head morphogenesis protein
MPLNDDISDRIIARTLRLNRFSASERRKILALHRELEADLTKLLIKVDPMGGTAASYQVVRQSKLLKLSKEEIAAGMRQMRDTQKTGLIQLARDEAEWFVKTANSEIGFNLVTKELSTQQLRAIVSDRLIQGAPSKDWWGRQAADLQRKFEDRVRVGMLKGSTTDEIVRTVRGTKAAGFADGIMEGSRRQAETLVRTSVQAVANEARGKLYEENQDIISGVTWVSTLDSRTSQICIALNGLSWKLPDYTPIGHKIAFEPPPRHFNCRSTTTAVFKSFKELSEGRSVPTESGGRSDAQTLFEKNLRDAGMSEEKIKQALFNARASMDGQVPKDQSFGDWLGKKPVAFQDELLGKGKAQLWRDGKIALTDLVNQDARPLTLAELRAKFG